MATLIAAHDKLGLPIVPVKCEGPVTMLTYLGIAVHRYLRTMQIKLRLGKNNCNNLTWLGIKAGRRCDSESLMGLLQHAAIAVCPVCRFVKGLSWVKDKE